MLILCCTDAAPQAQTLPNRGVPFVDRNLPNEQNLTSAACNLSPAT
ncbi:hypothetical protein [Spirosoma sp. KCTC 42546]|nr:hypothetical protein [Spirosoma sp. KCTC 42546]